MTFKLATILWLAFTPVSAQDFGEGLAAYRAGDYAAAIQLWEPLARKGNVEAQLELGFMREFGLGSVSSNKTQAVRWYRLAANQGHPNGQTSLGVMYNNGTGVPQNYAKAHKWYLLAAEQGYSRAQKNLGGMYQIGQGVIQDKVIAHMWYNIASANGDEVAAGWRDNLSDLMTPKSVEEAQAMARECMSSGYKKCGY